MSIPTARANSPVKADASWLDDLLRTTLFRFFIPGAEPSTLQGVLTLPPPPLPPPCAIDPIPAIEDETAQSFEAAAGTSAVVDVTGLTPATALALARFEQRVASLGGKFEVTSGYRPPAYQEHLQAVWDRWKQLRENRDEGCAALRSEVAVEFERHRLMESQRPVPFSDHTRGIGFDATVFLPAKRNRSIDRLAQQMGVRRPDVVRDPVHFRLAVRAGKTVRSLAGS